MTGPALLTEGTLSTDELSIITRLSIRHDAEIPELEVYDSYYEGTQPLSYMHPDILREVADRIRPVIIFWPQMVVDSIEERLRLDGFKTGDEDTDKELGRVWSANDMTLGFRQAVLDALIMRRAYVCVGTNPDDAQTPLVTPESPIEVFGDPDPQTRQLRAALRRVSDVNELGHIGTRYATLYLPDQTIWTAWEGGWKVTNRDRHNLGRVPIVPVINRPRLRSTFRTPRNLTVERIGRSDLDAVKPISDAACKMATDMMVAAEFLAVPLRGLFGIGPDDLKDEAGNPISPLQAMMGRFVAISDPQAKAAEWAAAQLQNFTGALDRLAQLVASISGLPPHYLGMSSDNPASADAIAASEARLNTRAERKQDSFGCAGRGVAQLIRRFQTGDWDPAMSTVRMDWRSPATPTIAAMSDAAVKLYQAKIVPLPQTRESLGYTDVEIEAMEEIDSQTAAQDPLAQIARSTAGVGVPVTGGAGAQYSAG